MTWQTAVMYMMSPKLITPIVLVIQEFTHTPRNRFIEENTLLVLLCWLEYCDHPAVVCINHGKFQGGYNLPLYWFPSSPNFPQMNTRGGGWLSLPLLCMPLTLRNIRWVAQIFGRRSIKVSMTSELPLNYQHCSKLGSLGLYNVTKSDENGTKLLLIWQDDNIKVPYAPKNVLVMHHTVVNNACK